MSLWTSEQREPTAHARGQNHLVSNSVILPIVRREIRLEGALHKLFCVEHFGPWASESRRHA